jgi:hypothetical protein
VGAFTDDRGTDANWLGAIRGGYGNPLKKLYTDRPVSEVVEQAFSDALKARKLLGDRQNAKVEVTGEIIKFDCSYYFNREAHAHLLVKVLSLPSRMLVFFRAPTEPTAKRVVGAPEYSGTPGSWPNSLNAH